MSNSKFILLPVVIAGLLLLSANVHSVVTSRQADEPLQFSVGYNFFGVSLNFGLSQRAIEHGGCVLENWLDPNTKDVISYDNRMLFFHGTDKNNPQRITSDLATPWIGYLIYTDTPCTVPVKSSQDSEQKVLTLLPLSQGFNTIMVPTTVNFDQLQQAGCGALTWTDKDGNPIPDESGTVQFGSIFLTFGGTVDKIQRIATQVTQPRVGYLVYVTNKCQISFPDTTPPEIRIIAVNPSLTTISSGTGVIIDVEARDVESGLKKIFVASILEGMTIIRDCQYNPVSAQLERCSLQFSLNKRGENNVCVAATNGDDIQTVLTDSVCRKFTVT